MLSEADSALLKSFGLTLPQKREVNRALKDAPVGLLDVARQAREFGLSHGSSGAGLLLHLIRKGDHFEVELTKWRGDVRKITGWRWTRGSHGETWVRDPEGRDMPPRGYSGG